MLGSGLWNCRFEKELLGARARPPPYEYFRTSECIAHSIEMQVLLSILVAILLGRQARDLPLAIGRLRRLSSWAYLR